MGPDGLVAAFWDDFRADTAGASGVFTWHDAQNHRFVIEWSRCVHVHGFRPPYLAEQQTFEAALYDPQYYPTATGDGPMLFQYLSVQNDDSLPDNSHDFATVGIGNPDHNDGLECTFAGAYPAAAAVVGPNRAIRFTTNPPDSFIAVREFPGSVAAGSALRAVPNPARRRVSLAPRWTPEPVRLSVLDVLGREVCMRVFPARTPVTWDLRNRAGTRVSAGVYRVVLTRINDGVRLVSGSVLVLE
jgi:hypothetical protein